jgi:hypothetical protein
VIGAWDKRWEFFARPIPHHDECRGQWENCRQIKMVIDDARVAFPYCQWAFNRHSFDSCREAILAYLEDAFGPITWHHGGLARESQHQPFGESTLEYNSGNWFVFSPVGLIPPSDLVPRRKRLKKVDGYCYFYGSEDGRLGYIGQTVNPDQRRRDHMHGRYGTTLELNATLAERGEMGRFMFWKVGPEQSLDEWEKYYADKFRERGVTLVNVAPLSLVH